MFKMIKRKKSFAKILLKLPRLFGILRRDYVNIRPTVSDAKRKFRETLFLVHLNKLVTCGVFSISAYGQCRAATMHPERDAD